MAKQAKPDTTKQAKANKLQIADATDWKEALRASALSVGFNLQLTKSMLQMLCAVADDVTWDRALFPGLSCPDNWIGTQASLVKRELIQKKTREEIDSEYAIRRDDNRSWEWSNYRLTPAGELVVQLIKLAGVFVEADAAIRKKSRSA